MNKTDEEKFLCKKINDLFSVRLKLQKKLYIKQPFFSTVS